MEATHRRRCGPRCAELVGQRSKTEAQRRVPSLNLQAAVLKKWPVAVTRRDAAIDRENLLRLC